MRLTRTHWLMDGRQADTQQGNSRRFAIDQRPIVGAATAPSGTKRHQNNHVRLPILASDVGGFRQHKAGRRRVTCRNCLRSFPATQAVNRQIGFQFRVAVMIMRDVTSWSASILSPPLLDSGIAEIIRLLLELRSLPSFNVTGAACRRKTGQGTLVCGTQTTSGPWRSGLRLLPRQ